MAVRALTPATRRRLGAPLLHQLPDGTQARPSALLFLSSLELIRFYLQFPVAIPVRWVDSYALLTRSPLILSTEVDFFVRLACVRRAASVHPEPGSNPPFEWFDSHSSFVPY